MKELTYDQNYFITAVPIIDENEKLREPQKIAYGKIYEHFMLHNKTSHAIVVLPTGVGKTGLMGLIPYGISQGRVLIITPQLVIKDTIIGSLDPDQPNNFWLSQDVFSRMDELPCLVEYEGNTTKNEILEMANIVVVNIQKLQERLTSNLMNRVRSDFFDMIIIDEAHHSTATTWIDCLQYFSNAKVVKLTGTPYRTDKEKIVGEIVFKYKLSAAMAKDYVKSLERFKYIPDELYLTMDNDPSKKYTVDEILALNLKDEDWISRTVAYSIDCSEKVVIESIKKLEEKMADNNNIPHKIIAVACSIPHAKQIAALYEAKHYACAIVHSGMSKDEIRGELLDIENHRKRVLINVAMLGEGYDHPYLSIGAIFRPFRSDLPYAQFIGRILRAIPESDSPRALDNIAQVICHDALKLDALWEYYKKEIKDSETIKYLAKVELDDDSESKSSSKTVEKDIGKAEEKGLGSLIKDTFLNTKLIEKRKKEEQEELAKLKSIQELLGITADAAKQILNQTKGMSSSLKRPDLYVKRKKKSIDSRIREDIVPNLLNQFDLSITETNLKDCRIFSNSYYRWIINKDSNNGGYLAMYINHYLNKAIGSKRDSWQFSDWDIAEEKLNQVEEFLTKVLEDFTNSL